ncbi:MAG TPA: YebC/PmpR family DNA-binding transcriptional regulator [Patescibacteria group bacterium]|nr:YebC/PmpR family DNA-binding transcriptional regulator [Patescibacteria group bacterium]
MSGHSKWATIKRAKAVTDAKKGKAFTKVAKNITIAVQTGGGGDPAFNFQLRQALEKAKEAGMPKDNIDRAIKRGTGEGKDAIKSVTYEGYGPAGSAFIVDAVTDNSNRTLQAIRTIFTKHAGRMGEQGSVAWMFESKGQILLENQAGTEGLELELIDQGVEDVKESEEGLEIYTLPVDLEKIKKYLEGRGFKIASAEIIMKPNQGLEVSKADADKINALAEALEEDDDVINVHTNVNL